MDYSLPAKIEEFKDIGDDWEVSGYPSTFNNIDRGEDIVFPGAYARTLASKSKVRFLWSHSPMMPLGVPKRLLEDKRGLFGTFRISKTRLGEETHQLVKDGAVDSFSIGFIANDYSINKQGIRELKSVSLIEVSLVAVPMNDSAIITDFKSFLPGFDPGTDLSWADKLAAYDLGLKMLIDSVSGYVEKDQPLTEVKRQELSAFLETFSGMNNVCSKLQDLLAAPGPSIVMARKLRYQLSEAKKRHNFKE